MQSRSLAMVLGLVFASPGAPSAQVPAQVAFDSARYAWEAGRYPEALQRLEPILTRPCGRLYAGACRAADG